MRQLPRWQLFSDSDFPQPQHQKKEDQKKKDAQSLTTSRTLPRIPFQTTRLQTEIVSCMHLSETVSLCHCDVITRLSCMFGVGVTGSFCKRNCGRAVGAGGRFGAVRLTCDPSDLKCARLPAIFRHIDFDHRRPPVIGPV
jgi:hypothetical protein